MKQKVITTKQSETITFNGIDWEDSIIAMFRNEEICILKKQFESKGDRDGWSGLSSWRGNDNEGSNLGRYIDDELLCFTGDNKEIEFLEWALDQYKNK
ncbi:MAG: hypothetical protein KAJ18_06400 [Candidatus Omnitrophica bacterium]|nr:hypothetical protein [Candidatus Omnitrophota bacterium]